MKILYLPYQYSQQRQREKKRWIYPVLLAMQAEWYRKQGNDVVWDGNQDDCLFTKVIQEPEALDFLSLPHPDRIFTNAFDKKYQNNGNFKYHPATYMQVANGCWWGKCEFCVEKNNAWQVRPVEAVIEELKEINRLGFKEVFDDSGTFPTGEWLGKFIGAIGRERFRLKLGCNMRLVDVDYCKMRDSGFRMLLFGLESANQKTLDKINKGTKVEDIKYIMKAAKAGIDCHGAFMFGYPWESDEDSINTLRLAHKLLKIGVLRTAQASFYNPPDGRNNPSQIKYVKKLYNVVWSPQFWMNQLKKINDVADIKYIWRGIKEVLWNRAR